MSALYPKADRCGFHVCVGPQAVIEVSMERDWMAQPFIRFERTLLQPRQAGTTRPTHQGLLRRWRLIASRPERAPSARLNACLPAHRRSMRRSQSPKTRLRFGNLNSNSRCFTSGCFASTPQHGSAKCWLPRTCKSGESGRCATLFRSPQWVNAIARAADQPNVPNDTYVVLPSPSEVACHL